MSKKDRYKLIQFDFNIVGVIIFCEGRLNRIKSYIFPCEFIKYIIRQPRYELQILFGHKTAIFHDVENIYY